MITLAGGMYPELMRPFVNEAMASFGPERLMFGSDWPVCLKGGAISEVMELFYDSLPKDLGAEALRQIESDTAAAFYKINDPIMNVLP